MTPFEHELALEDALDHGVADSADSQHSKFEAAELATLLRLAETLKLSARAATPTDEFRAAGRQRLVAHMAAAAPRARLVRQPQPASRRILDRFAVWAARFTASVAALSFVGVAAANASANTLPGDPLYGVKQASEVLAIQTAPNESARQEILVRQADTRLDETARLLAQGREADAAATAARYDETISGATGAGAPASEPMQDSLQANQKRLTQLLQSAPPPAQAGLERALEATQRGLARARPIPATPSESLPAATTLPADQRREATPVPARGETSPAQPEATLEADRQVPATTGPRDDAAQQPIDRKPADDRKPEDDRLMDHPAGAEAGDASPSPGDNGTALAGEPHGNSAAVDRAVPHAATEPAAPPNQNAVPAKAQPSRPTPRVRPSGPGRP